MVRMEILDSKAMLRQPSRVATAEKLSIDFLHQSLI